MKICLDLINYLEIRLDLRHVVHPNASDRVIVETRTQLSLGWESLIRLKVFSEGSEMELGLLIRHC